MGRYYSGDIEGKFWFAVQSSDAAERFGVSGGEPGYISYYAEEENLPEIEKEIKNIEDDTDIKKIEKFFEERSGYTQEQQAKAGISAKELSDYADLILGRKIRDCVKEQGSCAFDAEL